MDLALVSHIASLKCRLPFMHFFDGYRTSAEIQKIEPISYDAIASIYPYEDVSYSSIRLFFNLLVFRCKNICTTTLSIRTIRASEAPDRDQISFFRARSRRISIIWRVPDLWKR